MPANNDSVCVQTYYQIGSIGKVVFDVTFDSGDGSFATTDLSKGIEGFILAIETNPGSPAPSNLYGVYFKNEEGGTVAFALNRTTATTEIISKSIGTYFNRPVKKDEVLNLGISGNSVNSATTKIILYYQNTGN